MHSLLGCKRKKGQKDTSSSRVTTMDQEAGGTEAFVGAGSN